MSKVPYKKLQGILSEDGFILLDALPSIELVHTIRIQLPFGIKGD